MIWPRAGRRGNIAHAMPKAPPVYRQPNKPKRVDTRGSAYQRGYTHKWAKLARQVRREEPLCRMCLARGLVVPSEHCDHIVPKCKGGTDERGNLQGLCARCNEWKGGRDIS